jgi:VanZ family protein
MLFNQLLRRSPWSSLSPRRKIAFSWSLLISWMALIFTLSHQSTLPSLETSLADLLFKKGAHVAVYAGLAVLWVQALEQTWPPANRSARWSYGLSFILTVLYAASDEWHQTFIPGRNGRLSDVFIDMGGALLGLGLLWGLIRYLRLKEGDSP